MAKYSDLNTNFNVSNEESKINCTDLENIKNSLYRLFTTTKGEVPFNRNYGTTLKYLLFETNLDYSSIIMFLYMDITTFEPRVELNPNDITITHENRNTVVVECNFIVPSLNNISAKVSTTLSRE